jgi:hypothetical protein
LQNNASKKKQEIWMLIILGLVLALIVLVSKFVIGINFSLMEQGGYISIGYHEVHGSQVWSLEFESFTGSITSTGELPEKTERVLTVHSGTGNSELALTVECGKEKSEYILNGEPLKVSIPGDKDKFTMTLSGTDVYSGYFNAVWD